MSKPAICERGEHCRRCRSRSAGGALRDRLRLVLGLDEPDFDCPFGVGWGEGAVPTGRTARLAALDSACGECSEEVDFGGARTGCRLRVNGLGRPCYQAHFEARSNAARTGDGAGCPHPDGSKWTPALNYPSSQAE